MRHERVKGALIGPMGSIDWTPSNSVDDGRRGENAAKDGARVVFGAGQTTEA
jgi:hypothetical protein